MKPSKTNRCLALAVVLAAAPTAYSQDVDNQNQAVQTTAANAVESSAGQQNQEAIETIVVTGTRLKLQAGDLSKQAIVITSDDIVNMGETTLEGALRRLPQNFGGLSPTTFAGTSSSMPGGFRTANGVSNVDGASTLNLRGIDDDTRTSGTLVLVDGRRLAKSGVQGGVQDISQIPASRVERIEVILDGASSIYGSDAIGGVVNIILKKEESFSVWGNYLDSYDDFGDFGEMQLGFNGGFDWDSGGISFGVSTRQSEPVYGKDVGFRFWSQRAFDFATGEPTPELNITQTAPPSSYAGSTSNVASYLHQINNNPNPTLADFAPGVGEGYFKDFQSVIPDLEQYNADVHVYHSLSDRVELKAGINYLHRDTLTEGGHPNMTAAYWDPVGPLLESVFGETNRVMWGMYPAYGNPAVLAESRTATVYTELTVDLTEAWDLTIGLNSSRNSTDTTTRSPVHTDVADLIGWNPFGDGSANANIPFVNDIDGSGPLQPGEWTDSSGRIHTGSIFDYLTREGSWSKTDNDENAVTLLARGDLFDLPGGTVGLAVGAEYRDTAIDMIAYNVPRGGFSIGVDYNDLDVESSYTSAFAEFNVPIVGDGNSMTGIQSLSLLGSLRYEESEHEGQGTRNSLGNSTPIEPSSNKYDETTYSIGLVYSPVDIVSVKLNHNTSFKAPELVHMFVPVSRNTVSQAVCDRVTGIFGGPAGWCPNFGDYRVHPDPDEWWQPFPYTLVSGGNPNLKPERSENWSATIEVRPIDGLHLAVTWSEREFLDKTVSGGTAIANLGENAHEQLSDAFLFEPGTDYVIEGYRQWINADLNIVESIDWTGNYSFDTPAGSFGINAIWTTALTNVTKIGDATDEVEAIGINSPRESGQFQLTWSYEGWSAAVDTTYRGATVNRNWYVGNARFFGPQTGTRAESWTSTNFRASYDFDDTGSWLSNTRLALGINNVFRDFQKINHYFEGELKGPINANALSNSVRPRSIFLEFSKQF